jgi:hypothetical protein
VGGIRPGFPGSTDLEGFATKPHPENKTMTTKLNGPFKRELEVNGEKYTLTLSPDGFKLVQKGKRKGVELQWTSLLNGEAALANALNASTLGGTHAHGPEGRGHTKH